MWSKRLEIWETGENESHLKWWVLQDETQVKHLRMEESQKQTSLVRHEQKLPSSQDLLLTLFMSVYLYELWLNKSKYLSSSSFISFVFGVIIELTCWINKHAKSYSFCSSTHLIQNALENFILITQSPEPPWKLQLSQKASDFPSALKFLFDLHASVRVNSNQTVQLRDWSGEKISIF